MSSANSSMVPDPVRWYATLPIEQGVLGAERLAVSHHDRPFTADRARHELRFHVILHRILFAPRNAFEFLKDVMREIVQMVGKENRVEHCR